MCASFCIRRHRRIRLCSPLSFFKMSCAIPQEVYAPCEKASVNCLCARLYPDNRFTQSKHLLTFCTPRAGGQGRLTRGEGRHCARVLVLLSVFVSGVTQISPKEKIGCHTKKLGHDGWKPKWEVPFSDCGSAQNVYVLLLINRLR